MRPRPPRRRPPDCGNVRRALAVLNPVVNVLAEQGVAALSGEERDLRPPGGRLLAHGGLAGLRRRWRGRGRGVAGTGGVEAPPSEGADPSGGGGASRAWVARRFRYDSEGLVLVTSRVWS